MADSFACGTAHPDPLNGVSSQHHGRCPPCTARSESTVGASNWGGFAEANYVNFFLGEFALMATSPPLANSQSLAKLPSLAKTLSSAKSPFVPKPPSLANLPLLTREAASGRHWQKSPSSVTTPSLAEAPYLAWQSHPPLATLPSAVKLPSLAKLPSSAKSPIVAKSSCKIAFLGEVAAGVIAIILLAMMQALHCHRGRCPGAAAIIVVVALASL
jgi:hypothetical protein